jgi:hypothetical protein
MISFFDPQLKDYSKTSYFSDLFEIAVMEDTKIIDIKHQISQQLKAEKGIDLTPEKMRLREVFAKSPTTVFSNNKTLKESTHTIYTGKILAVQVLESPQTEKVLFFTFFFTFLRRPTLSVSLYNDGIHHLFNSEIVSNSVLMKTQHNKSSKNYLLKNSMLKMLVLPKPIPHGLFQQIYGKSSTTLNLINQFHSFPLSKLEH